MSVCADNSFELEGGLLKNGVMLGLEGGAGGRPELVTEELEFKVGCIRMSRWRVIERG